MTLTETDRLLLNRLQDGVPASRRPFARLAAETGMSERIIADKVRDWLDSGLLTRFGPMFNADRMGGAFCLCAIAAPEERFDAVADIVNGFAEVAHNYRREHRLNMWFVLATETREAIDRTCRAIEAATGLEVLAFPKEAEYFVGFRVAA